MLAVQALKEGGRRPPAQREGWGVLQMAGVEVITPLGADVGHGSQAQWEFLLRGELTIMRQVLWPH